MKQLTILILKGCPYVGISLYNLCVPSGIGETAGSEVSIDPIFPLNVLAATILMAGKSRDERARARARCELELFLCSITTIALWGGRGIGAQKAREEALWFGSKLVALLLSVHSSPNNDTSTLVEISAKTRRAVWVPGASWGLFWDDFSKSVRATVQLQSAASTSSPAMADPTLFIGRAISEWALLPPSTSASPSKSNCIPVRNSAWERWTGVGTWCRLLHMLGRTQHASKSPRLLPSHRL